MRGVVGKGGAAAVVDGEREGDPARIACGTLRLAASGSASNRDGTDWTRPSGGLIRLTWGMPRSVTTRTTRSGAVAPPARRNVVSSGEFLGMLKDS